MLLASLSGPSGWSTAGLRRGVRRGGFPASSWAKRWPAGS